MQDQYIFRMYTLYYIHTTYICLYLLEKMQDNMSNKIIFT